MITGGRQGIVEAVPGGRSAELRGSAGFMRACSMKRHARWPLVIAMLCLAGCDGVPRRERVSGSQPSSEFIAELREAYAAFNRGDIDSALKPLDTRIEWSEPAEFPGGGTYHGREGVKRYLTQSKAGIAEGASEPERFVVAGNRVVVLVHVRVRPKGSDAWHEVRIADVYTVENGKAVQMKAFSDQQEALRWAGAETGR